MGFPPSRSPFPCSFPPAVLCELLNELPQYRLFLKPPLGVPERRMGLLVFVHLVAMGLVALLIP